MGSLAGSYFGNHLLNIPGYGIHRKVIVFESDDWGSNRIPSHKTYTKLKAKGIDMDTNPFNHFDSLETEDDLQALFQTLSKFRDRNGNYPVITTNFIVGNPDFGGIAANNFSEFVYETFVETYKRDSTTEGSWRLIEEGVNEGLIRPQFHGREHVNATHWLQLLREGNEVLMTAFREKVYCVDISRDHLKRDNLMASLDYETTQAREFAYRQLIEGMEMFEKIFGYTSESFMAPCNVWDEGAEQVLSRGGVKFIQSSRGQKIPGLGVSTYRSKVLTIGELSSSGQIYLVRNAYFEPSTSATYDWIGNCLRKIEAAFFWGKPAIVTTHRLNFSGSIFPENRRENLIKLKDLLKAILSRWPTVEFMSTTQLGLLYEKN